MEMEIKIKMCGLPSLDEQEKIEAFIKETLKDFEIKSYEYRYIRVVDSYKRG